ncbi:unnamed protein product, partial [Orchesella dallaii]
MNFDFQRPLTRYQALLEGPLTTWRFADAIHSEKEAMRAFVDWGLIPGFRNCPIRPRTRGDG